jgi:5-formyltetrahydrofolate cyclo-ligase
MKIMNKTELRQLIRASVAGLTPEQTALFDAQITSLFLTSQNFMPQSSIACYMPLKGEVSCKSIMQTLTDKGHTICLPAVIGREEPLVFRQYRPGDKLERGMMGPLEPAHTAREMIPDVILIPMLGFTRGKYRLGYGTGFYDRTLEAFRYTKPVKTVGLAFSIQETSELELEPHDIALNVIITEKEIIA